MANPYAASILDDVLKYNTTAAQPINMKKLMLGIKSCPFSSDG